jgi:hypothetical protein
MPLRYINEIRLFKTAKAFPKNRWKIGKEVPWVLDHKVQSSGM